MEIMETGPNSPGYLAKMEHARAELLAVQSFLELVEETGRVVEARKESESVPPAESAALATPADPTGAFEVNDTAAGNYWQTLKLAFGADAGKEEDEPSEEDEEQKAIRKRKKRNRRR